MRKYAMPVMYTVELVLPGGGNIVWHFNADDYGNGQANKLYDELVRQRATIVSSSAPRDVDGDWCLGVNLVVWDRHPSQVEATGLILLQRGWSAE